VRVEVVDETCSAEPGLFRMGSAALMTISFASVAQHVEGFRDELVERHGPFSLLAVHQFRAYPRRYDLQHADARVA